MNMAVGMGKFVAAEEVGLELPLEKDSISFTVLISETMAVQQPREKWGSTWTVLTGH